MSEAKKKAVWPQIVGLLIALPVLYFGSFGPACWITSRTDEGIVGMLKAYSPVLWVAERSRPVRIFFRAYAKLLAPADWNLWIIVDLSGEPSWSWGQTRGDFDPE